LAKAVTKLKGVYGKPLLKPKSEIKLTQDLIKKAGEIILEAVKQEIRKDMAKASGMGGGSYPTPYANREPVPIPNDAKFVDSFSYKIKGNSTIDIISNWPTAEAHVGDINDRDVEHPNPNKKGSGKFKMWWLVQPRVTSVPIITSTGEVIIRAAPMNLGDAWVHPGFARYSFVERGIKKGKEKFKEYLASKIPEMLLANFSLF
jgi:hypothetical protein